MGQTDGHDGKPNDKIVAAYVVFHRNVLLADGVLIAEEHGAAVRSTIESVNGLVIETPLSQIHSLADRTEVQWIEPPLPRLTATNAENRAITQVDDVQQAPFNLDGTDVIVLVYDEGVVGTHQDFSGRLTDIDGNFPQPSMHSSHVAGTLGGDGSGSTDNIYRGMAPNVTLLTAGYQGTDFYTDIGDLQTDYRAALTHEVDGMPAPAVLSNNSIGSNIALNHNMGGFPCTVQGDYGMYSSCIDAIVRGSLGRPIVIVWSAGNERLSIPVCQDEGHGDYYSIPPPSGAKNHISVGALNAHDDSMTVFSAWGPTDDGRLKPDVTAPGDEGDTNDPPMVTSCQPTSGYTDMQGTSMSAPTVSGIIALMIQDFRAQFPGQPDPLASTFKALLAQTAVDRGNVGPDYQFGYGSVRAKDAIELMRTGQFAERQTDQGLVQTFLAEVDGTSSLKITMAWNDPPAPLNVVSTLVNDLDLRAIDPVGGVHFPWSLTPQAPHLPADQTHPTHIDNIEQVFVQTPIAGIWTIEVRADVVPEGPQIYSIVGAPGFISSYLDIAVSEPVPALVAPGEPLTLDVTVALGNDVIVPGSEKLFYRFDGGTYHETAMVANGNDFQATIPPACCDSVPEFYVSIEGQQVGTVSDPPDGAASPYSYAVGEIDYSIYDEFEMNVGWTVSGGVTGGAWQFGNPTTCDRGNPQADADGTGQCYLTEIDPSDCNSDVDDGATTLTSPTMDASGGDIVLSYYRWFSNNTGPDPEADIFTVEISDDDGSSWSTLETVGPRGPGVAGGWFLTEFNLDDITGFTPNAQFRVRFTAEDVGKASIIEAGVDAVRLFRPFCTDACPDINGDSMVGVEELLEVLGTWGPCPGCPADFNCDGVVDVEDNLLVIALWGPCP